MINLNELNYKDKIDINEKVDIPSDYYTKMNIESLSNVMVNGEITLNNDEYYVNLYLSGTMMLHDSITYDIIPYNFDVKIEESLEKTLKTLDLISFLWHYIILEVPLRFTNSEEISIVNDNYRVISEEEYKKRNNPFKDFHME